MHWVTTIQQFPHKIYIPGPDNTVADALSWSWDFSGEGGPLKHGEDAGLGGPAQQVTAHPHQSKAQSH